MPREVRATMAFVPGSEALVARSIREPEWFWPAVIDYLGIPFAEPYRTVSDFSEGKPFGRWFHDGARTSPACASLDGRRTIPTGSPCAPPEKTVCAEI